MEVNAKLSFIRVTPRKVGLLSAVDKLLDSLGDLGTGHFAGRPEHHAGSNASNETGN